MRTDRELLELAAKAAGKGPILEISGRDVILGPNSHMRLWRPLDEDGDALRLAVQLQLSINICKSYTIIYGDFPDQDFLVDECPRRAIVRAAAEIGAAM